MQATVIHNPGSGSAEELNIPHALSLLGQDGLEVGIRTMSEGDDPSEVARAAVRAGSRVVIASGGDGTVSAVAKAVIGQADVSLGILPNGTANSIAAQLKLPTDTAEACAVIRGGKTRQIDTARVNDHPMVLLATIGVHADAVTEANPDHKRLFGPVAYVISEAQQLVSHPLFDVSVEVNGEWFSSQVSALTVANMAPPFNLLAHGHQETFDDDGLLDVTLISLAGAGEAVATTLHLAYQVVAGLPADRDNIGFFRTSSLRIETSEAQRVMVDGDCCGETPIQIECLPRSLRVITP